MVAFTFAIYDIDVSLTRPSCCVYASSSPDDNDDYEDEEDYMLRPREQRRSRQATKNVLSAGHQIHTFS
jgi:hypothetical protein